MLLYTNLSRLKSPIPSTTDWLTVVPWAVAVAVGVGLVVLYLNAIQSTSETSLNIHDAWLRSRMGEVNLPTWKALQQTSGLSEKILRKFRKGDCQQLPWRSFGQLAQALDWPLSTLLEHLNLVTSPNSTAFTPESGTTELDRLRQECLALRQELAQQDTSSTLAATQQSFFELQPLLTQFPTVPRMVEIQPQMPARNLLAMFSSLNNWLTRWEITPIGEPWQSVKFDPKLHQPDASDIAPDETVYVRFVGYRQGDDVLVRAKVSRTLPSAASSSP